MDELTATAVAQVCTSQWIGRSYYYYPELGSTNDELKRLAAASSLAAGTVVLADFQRQGRGRLNRGWFAPPGSSLLHSILFWPDWPPERANWLTMMVGVAAVAAIEAVTGLAVGLKWPNDVMVQQAGVWHKVGGILLEGQVGGDGRLQQAIVGFGLNVNVPAAQMPETVTPATSLMVAGGRPFSRLLLLAAFWQQLEGVYETAESPHLAWQQRLITLGQPVQVSRVGQPTVVGVAEGTDVWGQLLVRDESGVVHTVAAGDVTLRPER
ncbi:MAG: biotin--[acetyl-CoA-carboxylase] ligase [Ardenticatenaceae bacterium]|nr:biotin--[acetyl-CoA-carboxylase] ligase [Ardenticatenaceae bacterium]